MSTFPGGISFSGNGARPPIVDPSVVSPPQTSSQSPAGSTFFSPSVLAIIGILGAFFLLVSYYTIWVRYCTSRRVRHGRGREIDEDGGHAEATWPMLTRGLEESVIKMIPVCNFSKEGGLVDGTDCAVCLSEFEENELLRLLPKCNHAFHLPCIDEWLQTHSNCPLCRANVISVLPRPPQVEQPPAAVAEDGTENSSQSPLLDGSSQEEAGNHDSSNEQGSHQIAVARVSQVSRGSLPGEQGGEGGGDQDRDLKALQPLKREDKFSARYPAKLSFAEGAAYLAQMRSLSTGRTFSYKQEGRWKYGNSDFHCMGKQKTDYGSNPSSQLRRSYSSSTGSPGRDVVVDLLSYREWQQKNTNLSRSGKALHPVRDEVRAPSFRKACNYATSEHATTNTRLHATVDIEATGSTSRQLKSELKSKSFRYESKSKVADASGGDPVMGKMLQPLKGPFGMKRSFSAGRVFSSFMNTNRA